MEKIAGEVIDTPAFNKLALDVKFYLYISLSYMSMVTNADQWKWRQIRLSLTNESDVKYVFSLASKQHLSYFVGREGNKRAFKLELLRYAELTHVICKTLSDRLTVGTNRFHGELWRWASQ